MLNGSIIAGAKRHPIQFVIGLFVLAVCWPFAVDVWAQQETAIHLLLVRPSLLGWTAETQRETVSDLLFLARETLPATIAALVATWGVLRRRYVFVWIAALVPLTHAVIVLRGAAHWFLGPLVDWLP